MVQITEPIKSSNQTFHTAPAVGENSGRGLLTRSRKFGEKKTATLLAALFYLHYYALPIISSNLKQYSISHLSLYSCINLRWDLTLKTASFKFV